MIHFEKYLIPATYTIRQTLGAIDALSATPPLTVFVTDEAGKAIGSVTDGDIRRGLIRGHELEEPVTAVMKADFTRLTSNKYGPQEIKAIKQKGIQLLPIVDAAGYITRLVNLREQLSFLPIDAVIMAGGEGRRLRPLTNYTPKPLLPVGDKPILEHNIDRLVKFGISHITITIKYLGEKIKAYFGNGEQKGIQIEYVEEHFPMGTAGALSLVPQAEHDTVLLMNSDLLTNLDYEDFYELFVNEQADLAVACIPYEVKVPYAVMETRKGKIHAFKEKPTYTYYSNAGIYLLKRAIIDETIPSGQSFDATDLMEKLIQEGRNVVSYPLRSYWLDIGRQEDYDRAQEDIQHIKL
ncbi:MAG: nucleotidyltransferase family protein [Saprospiraceae bacterium]